MAQTINKDAIVEKLLLTDAFSGQTKKFTKEFVEDFFQSIVDTVVAGDSISIAGFGKFEPYTKQDGSLKPKFTAFTAFKDAVKASK